MHRCRPCCKLDRRRRNAHTFSLLINSLVDFQHRVDFKVSQRLGLKFYRSYSPMLFCNPLHVHFSTIKHLLLALVFNKRFAKFSLIFYWERCTFKSQCTTLWHRSSSSFDFTHKYLDEEKKLFDYIWKHIFSSIKGVILKNKTGEWSLIGQNNWIMCIQVTLLRFPILKWFIRFFF